MKRNHSRETAVLRLATSASLVYCITACSMPLRQKRTILEEPGSAHVADRRSGLACPIARTGESLMNSVSLFCKKYFMPVKSMPFFLIAALLLLTACGKTPIIMPPSTGTPGHASVPPPSPAGQKDTVSDHLEAMRKAYNSGRTCHTKYRIDASLAK